MTTTFNAAATKTVRVNGTNFVYREIGNKSGIPVVFLHHLTAVLEDWDPAIADGLAKSRPVMVFDNRGVGGSGGRTPDNVADMAKDAIDPVLKEELLDLAATCEEAANNIEDRTPGG
jgi:pimeloyl-ACP methyl ester carboxylesterase